MKQFFQFVFASCLGVILASVVIFFFSFIIMAAIAGSSSEKKVSLDANSVLHLTFGKPIPEQTNNLEMNPFDLKNQEILGLNDLVASIEHAAGDNKIKGVYLHLENGIGAGLATAATLRNALVKFKESGKFVVAYSKSYTQGAYYLASVADKIYVNPMGSIDFHGFSATIPFFKEMLDKVGVKMQIFYAGNFKSATEPYRLDKMSDENRLQMREFLEPVYKRFLEDIGKSRNKSVAELRSIADELKVRNADDAVKYGLADAVGYSDDVSTELKQRLGLDKGDKVHVISIEDYKHTFRKKKDYAAKDKIALVFAEGAIYANEGERGTIVDDDYIKTLRKIREDESFKAIVLRINSPGGSALASENIWRELSLAKEAGKKVVVSMGDYAASGGYYIACMADKIVAEPNTLTGSIGVFQMIPNARSLMDDKLGISMDTVKTARFSTRLNVFYELTPEEQAYMQNSTNEIYEIFLGRVGEGRKMKRDEVHAVAQGRIWTGTKAKELGLVDEIGDLNRAIELAVELSGIEKYRVSEFPYQKEPLQEFIEEFTGQSDDDAVKSKIIEEEMGGFYPMYRHLKDLMNMKGVQARLPVLIQFN
jgi:protease-4